MLRAKERAIRPYGELVAESAAAGRDSAEAGGTWRSGTAAALALLRSAYGVHDDEPTFLGFVPGRIELLGKHTDYAGGHSLLAAVDRGFTVAAVGNNLGCVRLSEHVPPDVDVDVAMDMDRDEFPPVTIDLAALPAQEQGDWSNYPITAIRRLVANFGGAGDDGNGARGTLRGADLAFCCDLPIGGGLSGSSALIIMTAIAFMQVNRLTARPLFRRNIRSAVDLAMYLACVENGQSFGELAGAAGVGTFGGSEDHTAILDSRAGQVAQYRFAPTAHVTSVRWPPGWHLVVAFSGVRAEKTRAAMPRFNAMADRAAAAACRYAECAAAAIEPPPTLRSVADAIDKLPAPLAELFPDPWLRKRVVQFVREDRRYIPAAVAALRAADATAFGDAVERSHRASRELLGNIAAEVDTLQRLARELGAIAASGFGAGFGGSAYAVVQQPPADFIERWRAAYAAAHPEAARAAAFLAVTPASGVLDLSGPGAPRRWIDAHLASGSANAAAPGTIRRQHL